MPIKLNFFWAAMLNPLTEGVGMTLAKDKTIPFLQGSSSSLAPVFYLSGNPDASPGPFPSLANILSLDPGNHYQIIWALASLLDIQSSCNLARQTIIRSWEAEITRLDRFSSNQVVEIESGDPSWDAAFALSQKVAAGLVMGLSPGLPYSSFVLNRQPDQGYSPHRDGKDYGYLWNGQSPLEAYYLASLILPGGADLARGWLRNFLSTQTEDGSIDLKPGLVGQRNHLLATPLLAALTWKIYLVEHDKTFLIDIFPALIKFIEAWFKPSHDRDNDGLPEWDHPYQSGFDENPLFEPSYSGGQAFDITTFESPSMGAFLYNEIQCLFQIAGQLDEISAVQPLLVKVGILRKLVEDTWDQKSATYRYQDRDTHLSLPGKLLGSRKGSGKINLHESFKKPRRLQVRITTAFARPSSGSMNIYGTTSAGADHTEISLDHLFWQLNQTSISTPETFLKIGRIEITGISDLDEVFVSTIDFTQEDITLLLPLWAQIPHPTQAESLVKKAVLNPKRYALPYGISFCPENIQELKPAMSSKVSVVWNQFILEGLLTYGHRAEAAKLFTQLMAGVVKSLKEHQSFYQFYDAHSGTPSGEKNYLGGLAPLGLFLEILGVGLISPREVILEGISPFPRPITVKYRGLTVLRQVNETRIIFPDGQSTIVTGPERQVVSLS